MKTFHNLKCEAYLLSKLKTANGVIRNREPSLATPGEIK